MALDRFSGRSADVWREEDVVARVCQLQQRRIGPNGVRLVHVEGSHPPADRCATPPRAQPESASAGDAALIR